MNKLFSWFSGGKEIPDMDIRTQILSVMKDMSIDTTNISSGTHLKQDLEMDSTELVELAVALEKRLALPIDDTTFGKLTTFGEIEQFLQSLVAAPAYSKVANQL
jgi:acyl carrier protein